MITGSTIRMMRVALGLGQHELAKSAGLSQGSISGAEANRASKNVMRSIYNHLRVKGAADPLFVGLTLGVRVARAGLDVAAGTDDSITICMGTARCTFATGEALSAFLDGYEALIAGAGR